MKNFLQFSLPLLVICFVIGMMSFSNKTETDEKKLYITCNNFNEKHEIFTTHYFTFATNDEDCKLNVEILNVERDYIKIKSTYLWRVDDNNKIDKTDAKAVNIIEKNSKKALYSYDEKIKYIFEYK